MIKILAALFMLIDHIGMIFFPENYLLRIIGRVSMPLFPKYRLRFFPFGLRANLPLISALHGCCLYAL